MHANEAAAYCQLEDPSRALATLCGSIAGDAEDPMATEHNPKRRRTESRATAADSPVSVVSGKLSPGDARHTPPAHAHSLPAIRSPTIPGTPPQQLAGLPPPQEQPLSQPRQLPLRPPSSQYPGQFYHSHSHPQPSPTTLPAYPHPVSAPAASMPSIAPASARLFSAATGGPQLPALSHQQLGLVTHAAQAPGPASAALAGAPAAGGHLPQQFVSPHGIPASLLGHGSAVANADYGVWLYPHQQMATHLDRSAAAAAASVGALSASASPIPQHAIATAESQYPLPAHLDPQMRYMAVPGQQSGMPKPLGSAALSIDRSLRPISVVGQPQHGLAPMQYQPAQGYSGHVQYHPAYYHPQHAAAHPHQLHPSLLSAPHHSHHYHHAAQQQHYHKQQSPFTAQSHAMSATAPLSDSSSTQTSLGAMPTAGIAHSGPYGSMHPGAADQISSEHVSAAQVAAAVAAAASASAHTIPAVNPLASGPMPASVIGVGGGRAGAIDHEQSAVPAFKFTMGVPPDAESHLPEYFDSYSQTYMMGSAALMEPSPSSPTEQTLDADLMAKMDALFMKYLEAICSNIITVDSEGESIHQTQMAKKLEKLEQCTEYRTFRFRIQAFSNGFREFIEREAGLSEQVVSKQQLRNYLHQQHYISRYNEDGKKAKSKGHHVWNVEAKKISRNAWWFKEFLRRIASPPPKAVAGVPYEWTPTIWDPQIKAPKVYFSSEWLPPWLRWDNNSLRGLPPMDTADVNIVVIASYYQGKEVCHLKSNYTIPVVQHASAGGMFIP